jgi:limonene 1,2-monooxygenase
MELRHGVFLAPFHAMNENPTLSLQRDMELMELLDQLGFEEAWIGEHHSGGMEIIDSPELFIAAAAERTKYLRFGTGVVSLPYHHPLNVANRLIQLDHMTRGRVMFGFGPGLLASDALMMGIEPETTRDRMAEGVNVILRLLRGEVVSEETEWYTLRDARVHLLPFTQPHPEVCVASAVTPSGGRLAGKLNLGMLCVAASESAGFNALETNWSIANEVAAEDGRTMDRRRLRVVLMMHLAETREQAKENIRFGTARFIDYTNNHMPRYAVPQGMDPVDWVIENDIAVVGTPDDAIRRIEQVAAKQGEFGAVLLMANNWADWQQTRRSYELYSRYVIPHFSRANENRYSSYDWIADVRGELVEKRTKAVDQMFAKHEAEWASKGREAPGHDT